MHIVARSGHEALLVWALILVFVVDWSVAVAFTWRLRSKHPDKWQELGRPGLLFQTKGAMRYSSFILRGEHKELEDGALDRLALAQKILVPLGVLAFVALVAYRMG